MTARTSGLPSLRDSSLLLGENAKARVARAGATAESPPEERGGDRLEIADERHERDDRGAEGSRGKGVCLQLPHRGGSYHRAAGQGDGRPGHREQGDEHATDNGGQESRRCQGSEKTPSGEPDERDARSHSEAGGDAEQIPVEHSVHQTVGRYLANGDCRSST
jgi:hypothetical protein